MKNFKYIALFLLFMLQQTILSAQLAAPQSGLEKSMFVDGKINVVYVVLSIVLVGLGGYALYTLKQIKKYEALNNNEG